MKNFVYQLVLGEPMAYLAYSHNPRESFRFASVLDDDYHFENSEKETKKRRQRKKKEKMEKEIEIGEERTANDSEDLEDFFFSTHDRLIVKVVGIYF